MTRIKKIQEENEFLKKENDFLKKIIENDSATEFPESILSLKNFGSLSAFESDFIFGFWEYDSRDQCFILDDILKNFFALEYNILDLDTFRTFIPPEERNETINTLFQAIENKISAIRFEQTIINPADSQTYVILLSLNNTFDKTGDIVRTEGSMINISELLKSYKQTRARIGNEKYIQDYSKRMNSVITEGEAVDFLLRELSKFRPAERIYLLCRKDNRYLIHSAEPDGDTGEKRRYSYSVSKENVYVNKEKLTSEGFIVKSPDFEEGKFYRLNTWLHQNAETLLILPAISGDEKFSFAVVDITPFAATLTSPDIITYHAMMNIFEGTIKRLEEETEHHRREMQYQLLVEQTPHMLWQMLPDGKLLFVNKNFAEYFDVPIHNLKGKNFFTFLTENQKKQYESELALADVNKPERNFNLKALSPGGVKNTFRIATHSIFHATGKLLLINIIAEDIPDPDAAVKEKQ